MLKNYDSVIIMNADVFISSNSTIRKVAKKLGISKTTLHYRLNNNLAKIDAKRYRKVRKILDKNKRERHLRGGMATKRLYSKK